MDDHHAASLRAGRRTEPRLQAGSPSPLPAKRANVPSDRATPTASSTGSEATWPTVSTSTMWAFGVILLPYLGVFLYLIFRGGKMHQRAVAAAEAQDAAFR